MSEGLGLLEAIPHHVLGPAPQEGAKHQSNPHGLASSGHLCGSITEEGRSKQGHVRAQKK